MGGEPCIQGGDAKREHVIEGPLKRTQSKRALRQQVPVKSRHVTQVKNNAVSLGNRPVVDRLFANHTKYVVSARAGVKQSAMKVVPDADSGGESSHGVFPLLLDASSARRMRQTSALGG